jgi:hypothetical protein
MIQRVLIASQSVRLVSSGALLASAIAVAVGCQSTPPPGDSSAVPPDDALGAADAHSAAVDGGGVPEEDLERSSVDVTDAEVEAFARAYVAVVEVEQKYTPEIQAAASPQEAESVQAEAQREMQDVIESQGMTLIEFEQIGTKANDDEGLRMRLEQKLVEIQQQPEQAR